MAPTVRNYHFFFSRNRVKSPRVIEPRHCVLYRCTTDGEVEIVRILHDSHDLKQRLPEGYNL